MSLKAMIWVLHDAPTKNHTEFAILMALADRAGGHSDGDAAYPSQAWIADKAQCSVATVKRHLKELETRGLIKRGDQSIVSDFRVDRRPVVWDLCLDKTRTNSADNGSSNQAKSTVAQNEPPLNGEATVAQNEPNGSSNGDGTVAHSYELQTILNHPKPPINQPPIVPQGGRQNYPADFEEFWAAFPRRVGKRIAHRAWLKAVERTSVEEVLAGAQRFATDPNLPEERFIPHPTTWLNRDGWLDTPMPTQENAQKSVDDVLSEWGYADPPEDYIEGEIVEGDIDD
ncbi:helix-turn-helix domain-containing protein [Corynebacterium callunae]|uniref:helix-turn-helix domain-containing protein n=1 Tax=Corynebacterium callunae TaxID=1721 RepID=UPI0020004387|nr:helix-turn-helix domain-containing protein [Corynebacterium callunae]MCK2200205.1 helix-turn-helix domain-containing protein [Corynebacterium callunae]